MSRGLVEKGFTMVEVLVSVAVLSIASLGVMGVLTFGVVAGDSAGDFSTATQYGRELVENIRVDSINLSPFDPPPGLSNASDSERVALNAAPFDSPLMNIPADPRFRRNIQIVAWPGGGAVSDQTSLVRIRVRVFWDSPDQQQTSRKGERMTETVAFLRNSSL